MAEAAKSLLVRIGADVKPFEAGLRRVQKDLKGFSASLGAMQTVGKAGIAVGAAFGGALALAAREAAQAEQASRRLTTALRNVGITSEAAVAQADRFAESLERTSGFAGEDLTGALAQLTRSTGDLEQGMALVALATNVARGSGESLESVTDSLTRAVAGSVEGLRKYGLQVDADTTKTEAFRQLQRAFAGDAKAFMGTAAGAWTNFQNALGRVAEGFGTALLPAVTKAFTGLANLLDLVARLSAPFRTVVAWTGAATAAFALFGGGLLLLVSQVPAIMAGFHTLIGAVRTLSTLIKSLSVATLTNPWVLLAAALAAAGLAADHFLNEGRAVGAVTEKLREVFKGLFGDVTALAGPEGLPKLTDAMGAATKQAKALTEADTAFAASMRQARAEAFFFGDSQKQLEGALAAAEAKFRAYVDAGLEPTDKHLVVAAEHVEDLRRQLAQLTAETERAGGMTLSERVSRANNRAIRNQVTVAKDAMQEWFGFSQEGLLAWQDLSQRTFQTFSGGVSDAFAGALVEGQKFSDAMRALVKTLVTDIIRFFVQSGIQRAIATAFGMPLPAGGAAMGAGGGGGLAGLGGAAGVGGLLGGGSAGTPVAGTFAGEWAAMGGGAGAAGASATASIMAAFGGALIANMLGFMAGSRLGGGGGQANWFAGLGTLVGGPLGGLFGGALSGIFHGGTESVPETGTYLLRQGERVVQPAQNRDLGAFLDLMLGRGMAPAVAGAGGGSARPQPVHVHLELDGRELADILLDVLPGRVQTAYGVGRGI